MESSIAINYPTIQPSNHPPSRPFTLPRPPPLHHHSITSVSRVCRWAPHLSYYPIMIHRDEDDGEKPLLAVAFTHVRLLSVKEESSSSHTSNDSLMTRSRVSTLPRSFSRASRVRGCFCHDDMQETDGRLHRANFHIDACPGPLLIANQMCMWMRSSVLGPQTPLHSQDRLSPCMYVHTSKLRLGFVS